MAYLINTQNGSIALIGSVKECEEYNRDLSSHIPLHTLCKNKKDAVRAIVRACDCREKEAIESINIYN